MTLSEARKTLATQITAAELDEVTVYNHEPAMVTAGVSVTVSSAGFSPTEWLLSVRVYVTARTPESDQDLLDQHASAVDAVLDPAPREQWDFGFDEDRNAFVAEATVSYPREDF